jgi:hypothetical protein
MKIFTKLVYDIETLRLLDSEWYEYAGPVARAKGANPQEQQIATLSSGLASTLAANYNTMFAGQSAILGSLTAGLTNIFNAGPGQQGWTPAEAAAINTQTTQGVASTYNQALTAVNQAMGAKGGGNTPGVFSGPQSQADTSLAEAAANSLSSQRTANTIANYQQGNQNYWAAASALGNTAKIYNPTAYSGQAGSTANSAFGMANTINQQNQAASPWSAVAGILGGVAGAFIGDPGLGGQISGIFGGGGVPSADINQLGWNQSDPYAQAPNPNAPTNAAGVLGTVPGY